MYLVKFNDACNFTWFRKNYINSIYKANMAKC